MIISCDGNDPLPAPTASFFQDKIFIEIGEQITFTSTSTGATIFEWNFGNGLTAVGQSTRAIFNNEGEYEVVFTALTEDDQSSTASSMVYVGERVVHHVNFDAINLMRPDNTPWDTDTTGPDFNFYYGEFRVFTLGSGFASVFSIGDDLVISDFPLELTPRHPFKFTNEDWYIAIEEIDRIDPNDDTTWIRRSVIPVSTFNPLDFGVTNNETGFGEMEVLGGGLVMQFLYQIVVDTED